MATGASLVKRGGAAHPGGRPSHFRFANPKRGERCGGETRKFTFDMGWVFVSSILQ